jgi:hypothetical protein
MTPSEGGARDVSSTRREIASSILSGPRAKGRELSSKAAANADMSDRSGATQAGPRGFERDISKIKTSQCSDAAKHAIVWLEAPKPTFRLTKVGSLP